MGRGAGGRRGRRVRSGVRRAGGRVPRSREARSAPARRGRRRQEPRGARGARAALGRQAGDDPRRRPLLPRAPQLARHARRPEDRNPCARGGLDVRARGPAARRRGAGGRAFGRRRQRARPDRPGRPSAGLRDGHGARHDRLDDSCRGRGHARPQVAAPRARGRRHLAGRAVHRRAPAAPRPGGAQCGLDRRGIAGQADRDRLPRSAARRRDAAAAGACASHPPARASVHRSVRRRHARPCGSSAARSLDRPRAQRAVRRRRRQRARRSLAQRPGRRPAAGRSCGDRRGAPGSRRADRAR